MDLLVACDGSLIRQGRLASVGFAFASATGEGEGYSALGGSSMDAEIMGLLSALRFASGKLRLHSRYTQVRILVDCQGLVRFAETGGSALEQAARGAYGRLVQEIQVRAPVCIEKCSGHAWNILNRRAHELAYASAAAAKSKAYNQQIAIDADLTEKFESAVNLLAPPASYVPVNLDSIGMKVTAT